MQSKHDTETAAQIETLEKELEHVKEQDQTHESIASYNIATKEAEFAKQKLDEDTELANAKKTAAEATEKLATEAVQHN